MARMKHQAIVGNIGHFDNEIDMAGLESDDASSGSGSSRRSTSGSFSDGHSIIVLSEGRLLNLGNATGHPSFVMSNSFTNQVIAQIELFTKNDEYEKQVYVLPKHLDEKVARLHLDALGVRLTELTAGAGRLPRRPGRGPVQVGPLPVLGGRPMPGATRELIERFYAAFDAGDGDAMAACYAPDVRSPTPSSRTCGGSRAGAMWRMLTGTPGELKIELLEHDADEATGSAHWRAHYVFTQTGRPSSTTSRRASPSATG